MAGVRKKPNPGGKYHGWYKDSTGNRRFFTGTRNRKTTEAMAHRLEDEHRETRLGYRPAKTSAQKQRPLPFSRFVDEYLEWGQAQGGWLGKPWSTTHAHNRQTQLTFWQNRLRIKTLGDLDGIQPRVEKILRTLQRNGKAGKTLANYVEGLAAFCDWCVTRSYLAEDPLKGIAAIDTAPKTRRRAMTPLEIGNVLNAAEPHMAILYETAIGSGLRANELRNLTLDHLDTENGGIRLEAEWTKNRRPGFQPLPFNLVHRLKEFGQSGEPYRLYQAAYRRGRAKKDPPQAPLLYVPSQPARCFHRDLEKVGIPISTKEGKLDFHAARVAYINMLFDSGNLTPKEVQELARHSTLDLTINTYGRANEPRMREAVERLGNNIQHEKRATCVQGASETSEQEKRNSLSSKDLRSSFNGSGGRARTYDMLVNSQPLCQLSYTGTQPVTLKISAWKIASAPLSVNPEAFSAATRRSTP